MPGTSTEGPLRRHRAAEQLFDAFNRRDLNGALLLVHPDIVFKPVSSSRMAGGEPYTGHEGIRRYFSDVEHHWRELVINPVHIRSAGRAVVALGHVSGSGRAGAFQDSPTTWVLKFEDDLVIHAQIFADERTVLEALGE